MMKRVTVKSLPIVWMRLTAYVVETLNDKNASTAFAKDLDVFLDGLAGDDAFGTEGQCDPRGDQRN